MTVISAETQVKTVLRNALQRSGVKGPHAQKEAEAFWNVIVVREPGKDPAVTFREMVVALQLATWMSELSGTRLRQLREKTGNLPLDVLVRRYDPMRLIAICDLLDETLSQEEGGATATAAAAAARRRKTKSDGGGEEEVEEEEEAEKEEGGETTSRKKQKGGGDGGSGDTATPPQHHQQHAATRIVCPQCKETERIHVAVVQTRSGDEDATNFVTCNACNLRWVLQ